MAYVIIELQTDENGNTATPPLKTAEEYDQAKSVFHQTAASASISSVPVHSVFFIDSQEGMYDYRTYNHATEGAHP